MEEEVEATENPIIQLAHSDLEALGRAPRILKQHALKKLKAKS